MYGIRDILEEERQNQIKIKDTALSNLKNYPKGHLIVRKTKNGFSYFSRTTLKGKAKEVSINKQPDMILALINKAIDTKVIKIAEQNIANLDRFLKFFKNNDRDSMINCLPTRYQTARSVILEHEYSKSNNCLNYKEHCKRDIQHNHLTNCGIWVRSKNELFICNSLDEKNIKFTYEEKVVVNGRVAYPDFVIYLPDGGKIIWEHLGMLDKYNYFIKNAEKIYDYYIEGYVPGKTLILTFNDQMDQLDVLGIKKIINELIFPYFE